ncbi:S26 family signal peptidase [Leucobacter luti]|uniref:Signal peptidase n=1 Tax=Leucobacter luti TaxID=340320 RepID=A0A4Q7U132_9MICO|nr:S26 family signal peptidase [Leucobacter luti]MBL3699095.1 S26 family signal peptidase [Leucobacter luti]RZT66597.1 signal peptidase [Leucobacter luti]
MRRHVFGVAGTTLLAVAAIALVGWFAVAAATGATLVIFRTGSMSPAIPQGALAVSVPVSAPDIRVGDVVTVQRETGTLPVSHRVVSTGVPAVSETAAGAEPAPADARELVLRGDANDTADAQPYVVREARRVVASAPWLGTGLTLLQSPLGLGLLVIGAGGITTWAFWPRAAGDAGGRGSDPGLAQAHDPAREPDPAPEPASGPRHARAEALP